jgi:uncharacterized protein
MSSAGDFTHKPLNYADDLIRAALRDCRRIAMLGASDNPERASFGVFRDLIERGYEVVPVNPARSGKSLLGVPILASLAEIVGPIDMVDIFRNSEAAAETVDEALALSPLPKVIWMQLGVRHDEAAARAEARGVSVIMDRCPKIELRRLFDV